MHGNCVYFMYTTKSLHFNIKVVMKYLLIVVDQLVKSEIANNGLEGIQKRKMLNEK